jgi:uncharacterized lipoprotein YddW (UPF0748 family)
VRAFALLVAAAAALPAQDPWPPVPREFRGVWVATVDNIDWPSRPGLPTDSAQAELLTILDRAQALHLNAVVFQVRPSADALYASSLEPWSAYLTGRQGRAPSPSWDPLAFAVREAHARGLELHAWFNPYRAKHPAETTPTASTHVSRARPAVVKRYGAYLWMDPGERWVRERTTAVILDVVRRYDVDGVHIDDYFYPYPEVRRGRNVPFPDDRSWQAYRADGGRLDRAAWRRRNVDLLVEALGREIHRVKPWVKFGVSPFGIWRPGHPAGIEGFDAYEKLYADARRWLREGWADYLSPQLYWPIAQAKQAYPVLQAWWGQENVLGRHLWIGNHTALVGARWDAAELVHQVRLTQADGIARGNVHFSMRALLRDAGGVASALRAGPYAEPALVPASPWLRDSATVSPTPRLSVTPTGAVLCLGPGSAAVRQWVVRAERGGRWAVQLVPGPTARMSIAPADRVVVSAVDRVGRETAAVEAGGAC